MPEPDLSATEKMALESTIARLKPAIRSSASRFSVKSLLIKIGFFTLLLIAWQLVAWAQWVPSYILPGPIDVGRSFIEIYLDGRLFISIGASLRRMFFGYGLSAVGGIVIGVLSARSQLFRDTFGSLILALQSIPSVCWLPFALIWIGLNEYAILAVVVLGAVFSIASATESAILNIPPIYLRVGRVFGAKGFTFARDILFFAALPELIGGLKLGWTFAWRSLMAAELIRQDLFGVGRLLETGRSYNDSAMMIAAMVTILIIGLIVDRAVFGTLESRIRIRWGLQK